MSTKYAAKTNADRQGPVRVGMTGRPAPHHPRRMRADEGNTLHFPASGVWKILQARQCELPFLLLKLYEFSMLTLEEAVGISCA